MKSEKKKYVSLNKKILLVINQTVSIEQQLHTASQTSSWPFFSLRPESQRSSFILSLGACDSWLSTEYKNNNTTLLFIDFTRTHRHRIFVFLRLVGQTYKDFHEANFLLPRMELKYLSSIMPHPNKQLVIHFLNLSDPSCLRMDY